MLADSVEANGESWFLARVCRLAAHEDIAGVVAFSDPVPRLLPTGQVGWIGHWGCIDQASTALYLGRTTPRRKTLLPDGATFNERSSSKLLGWSAATATSRSGCTALVLRHGAVT
ncbi:MAG: hypothetical protein QOE07_2305 [Acidimicrobiaceae bacterium]|nr:hypothetical protein [Acidimicrobiaceae bacterium]MDQ1417779.1 hypothetical protein [Acidimicrobiaceae bacterium]